MPWPSDCADNARRSHALLESLPNGPGRHHAPALGQASGPAAAFSSHGQFTNDGCRLRPAVRRSQAQPLGGDGTQRHGRHQPHARRAGRRRGAQARRQRDRRRDRGQRRARRGGADELRHRRRPVCHRVGRQVAEALRPQRQRSLAAWHFAPAHSRARARAHPAQGAAQLVGAGLRLRLAGVARPVRQTAVGQVACAGDSLRAGRLSGDADHRRLLEVRRSDPQRNADRQPRISQGRPRAGGRRTHDQPRPGQGLSCHRQGGGEGVLRGLDRRGDRSLQRVGRWPDHAARPQAAHRRLGRAGQRQLSRLRRLGTAAERPGHRRAADFERPRAARHRRDGPQLGRLHSPFHRGEETGVRRSGQVLRRPEGGEKPADRRADLQAVRQAAGQAHRHGQGGVARAGRRSAPSQGRHDLPDRRRQGSQRRVADPEQLLRIRLRPCAGKRRVRDAESRDAVCDGRKPSQPA